MFPRRTNNAEGSSRGGNQPRRRPRRMIVITTEEPVDGPPPGFFERGEERRRPRPQPPLPLPPPMDPWGPPTRALPPVPPVGRDRRRGERIWARAQEMLGRNRNHNFLNRIEREMALDRLEARQAEREAQRARQERLQEEALRQRREQERRQEREAERRLQEHLEEVTRRAVRDRQEDETPAARENPVEERPAPINRAPGLQVPAPVPAAPVVTPTRVHTATVPGPEPDDEDGELVICAVCTEEFPRSQVLSTSCRPEPHHYCRECLRSFFNNAMQGNVWRNGDTFPPTCCGNRFYIHADGPGNENPSREARARNLRFQRLLGVEMFRQYVARTEQVAMEREHTGTRCSNQDCGWLVPDRFMGVEGRRDTEVVCHNCRQVTCTICEGRAHRARYQERCPGPRRTTEEQQQAEAQADEQFRQLRQREIWPTCPTCGFTVERDGGCNLIHCIRCQTYFCYHCQIIHPNGHEDAGLCHCPTFGPGDAERRLQERREAGIPDHVPEGEEDDFLQGRDHEDGHRGGHHHDDWHPRGHNDRDDRDRHHLRHPHDDWDQHIRHFDERDLHGHQGRDQHEHDHHRRLHDEFHLDFHHPEDHDFFHGGDHADILDHIPERLLDLPIEVDSDEERFFDNLFEDDDDFDDDINFILDAMRRRHGGH